MDSKTTLVSTGTILLLLDALSPLLLNNDDILG